MLLNDEGKKDYLRIGDFIQSENGKSREVEVDIDELLDMDSDDHRRSYLQVSNPPTMSYHHKYLRNFSYSLTSVLSRIYWLMQKSLTTSRLATIYTMFIFIYLYLVIYL